MYRTAVAVCIGLTIASLLWQVISWEKDWGKAAEISFLQAGAIGIFLLVMAITS